MNEPNIPEPSRWPLRVGLAGTIAWLALFGFYTLPNVEHLQSLDPNELGDFLAGSFAPLAFLWIVVGYLQQSAELRLQVRELSQQVAATRQMAESAVAQSKRESLEAQPVFVNAGGNSGKGGVATSLKIRNDGEKAFEVEVGKVFGGLNLEQVVGDVVRPGDVLTFKVIHGKRSCFELRYKDIHQEPQSTWFHFDGKMGLKPIPFGEGPRSEEEARVWL
jgi:hypothetical protein